MARLFAKQMLVILVSMCMSQVSHAAGHALKTNPFARAVEAKAQESLPESAVQEVFVPFVLRGTMVAGQQSLANISGEIVSLGDEINGYKLVGIQQREIVLLKNNERRVLSVDDAKEGGQ